MSARTIYWPDPSWSETQARAEQAGVSLSAYVRRAVEVYDSLYPRDGEPPDRDTMADLQARTER